MFLLMNDVSILTIVSYQYYDYKLDEPGLFFNQNTSRTLSPYKVQAVYPLLFSNCTFQL